jgi:hypothetical protein
MKTDLSDRSGRVGAASILIALAVGLYAAVSLGADPPTLEERAAAIERASNEPDGVRVVVGHISRELRLDAETLRAQRAQTGLGWGDILIANRLAREAGLPFDQIAAKLQSGKRWAEIATAHHADLDRLSRAVERSQEVVEQREEDKAPHGDVGGAPAQSGAGRHGGGAGRNRR